MKLIIEVSFLLLQKSTIGTVAATKSGSRARLDIRNRQKLNNSIMASSENRDIVYIAALENEFKKDKCRAKSNFTRSRTKLLMLIEEHDMPIRREVKEACKKTDSCLEIVMDVLTNFSDSYTKK